MLYMASYCISFHGIMHFVCMIIAVMYAYNLQVANLVDYIKGKCSAVYIFIQLVAIHSAKTKR